MHHKAFELKNNIEAPEIISWRYNLNLSQVKNWMNETNWNYQSEKDVSQFEGVISYLREIELISAEEAEGWLTKLVV